MREMNWDAFRLSKETKRNRVIAFLPEDDTKLFRLWRRRLELPAAMLRPVSSINIERQSPSIRNVAEFLRQSPGFSLRTTIYFFLDPPQERDLIEDVQATMAPDQSADVVVLLHSIPSQNYDSLSKRVRGVFPDAIIKEVTEENVEGYVPSINYGHFKTFLSVLSEDRGNWSEAFAQLKGELVDQSISSLS